MAKRKKEEEVILSLPEMQALAADLEREIFALRNDLAVQRKLEKPHLLKEKRHERARLLTKMTQIRRQAT